MAKRRKFQITLTGYIPEGMTLAQVRHAYWNVGFNGDGPSGFSRNAYTVKDVDIDEYFDDMRSRRPMKVRLGRATLVKS